MYAQVIVDIAHAKIDRLFTYAVPEGMQLEEGQRVMVPFGKGNRQTEGFVCALKENADIESGYVKEIVRAIEPYPALLPDQMALARWIQSAYHCLFVDALRLMLPASVRKGKSKEKTVRTVALAEGAREHRNTLLNKKGLPRSPRQLEVFDLLANCDTFMDVADVDAFVDGGRAAVTALLAKGLIVEEGHVTFRRPQVLNGVACAENRPILNDEQSKAVDTVTAMMKNAESKVILLHGVTGSGKTEVYMCTIEEAIRCGKTAIVLVPEISLTPQTVDRFARRFGDGVAVLHSRLSDGERFDEWRRIRLGKVQVVVGARSAVFAPIQNIGIIVIDEEHEQTYQSETSPRYHALEVARKRCAIFDAPLVLGSATPCVGTYMRAKSGRYELIELKNRVGERPLPEVMVVDMRDEFAMGNTSIFSGLLYERLENCIRDGKQAILFLNRRGYSTFVSCRGCGHLFECPNCDVSLTYHRTYERVKCHYCAYETSVPEKCPKCEKKYLKYFGIGTQQVEEQFKSYFPNVNVIRMDMDTTSTKNAHQNLLDSFKNGEAQVLIGTQMIAKGLDFPNVTLVGVVAADATLHLPDYRSVERTFRLLTQVAGRAGRDKTPGEVVVQTYSPEHPAIVYAKTHDYKGFYGYEIGQRRLGIFPPYSMFIRVLFSAADEEKLLFEGEKFAKGMEDAIYEALGEENKKELLLIVSGPAPIARKRGEYRFQVLAKLFRTKHTGAVIQALYDYVDENRAENYVAMQINPGDML